MCSQLLDGRSRTRVERSAPAPRRSLRLAGGGRLRTKGSQEKAGSTPHSPSRGCGESAGDSDRACDETAVCWRVDPCLALFLKVTAFYFSDPVASSARVPLVLLTRPIQRTYIANTSGRTQCLQATPPPPPPHSDRLPASRPAPLRDGPRPRTTPSRREIRLRSTLRTLRTSAATALLLSLPGSNGSSPIADSVPRPSRPSSRPTFTPSARGRCQSTACLLPSLKQSPRRTTTALFRMQRRE